MHRCLTVVCICTLVTFLIHICPEYLQWLIGSLVTWYNNNYLKLSISGSSRSRASDRLWPLQIRLFLKVWVFTLAALCVQTECTVRSSSSYGKPKVPQPSYPWAPLSCTHCASLWSCWTLYPTKKNSLGQRRLYLGFGQLVLAGLMDLARF